MPEIGLEPKEPTLRALIHQRWKQRRNLAEKTIDKMPDLGGQ